MRPTAKELIPPPPVETVARTLADNNGFLWLDSAEKHSTRGRYSYLMAEPVGELQTFSSIHNDFEPNPELPPFQGGYAGMWSYDFGRTLETVPRTKYDEFEIPQTLWHEYSWVLAYDHLQNRAWIVANGEDAVATIRHVENLIQQPQKPLVKTQTQPLQDLSPQYPVQGEVTSNFSQQGYLQAVARAVEYTHAGDIFQVNLSQRLLAKQSCHPFELYLKLRQTNPAPFACYFNGGTFQIASASPEQFLHVCYGIVTTRPIKGTRRRGLYPMEDEALQRDLDEHPKDRAENVMIVDLLRNDIGKVCEYGSVTVPRICEIETFKDVHHLVSEVQGRLAPGKTAFDLLKAAFPGGSITGAPKVRAMEIIAELEPTARGAYCGTIGFVGYDGCMNTNILIRTITASRGFWQFPVGGGIVADSDPANEYAETLHKAAGLLRAVQS